jgi:hypothetical protein
VARDNVLPFNRFLAFSRQRGWLPEIAAGVVLIVIVGGFVLNGYLASRYGADGTAISYVQAIGSGDTATAWSLMTVASTSVPVGTADLATKAGLDGQLHLEPAHTGVTNLAVTGHRDVPGGVQVTVSYKDHDKPLSTQLNLVQDPTARHLVIYPTWRVLIAPSVVTIKSPGVPYGVDGHLLTPTTLSVRILPGGHVFATRPTELFGQFATTLDAEGGQPATASLEPKLTASAATGAAGAITQAFQACLANPYTGSCPAAFLQYSGHWHLIGDPGAGVTVAVGPDGKPIATGHYLATVEQSFGDGRVDRAVGGGYSAVLSQTGSSFKVESLIGSTSAPPLTRPAAATDSAGQRAVQAALAACIGSTNANPDDCPQGLSAGLGTSASAVHWSWDSDPMGAAKVTFDDQSGILLVTGKYAATGTYTWTLLGSQNSRTSHSAGTYEAQVVLEDDSLKVVTIKGA